MFQEFWMSVGGILLAGVAIEFLRVRRQLRKRPYRITPRAVLEDRIYFLQRLNHWDSTAKEIARRNCQWPAFDKLEEKLGRNEREIHAISEELNQRDRESERSK
jgi:hypothetical protein